jgi:hypothetical protein
MATASTVRFPRIVVAVYTLCAWKTGVPRGEQLRTQSLR